MDERLIFASDRFFVRPDRKAIHLKKGGKSRNEREFSFRRLSRSMVFQTWILDEFLEGGRNMNFPPPF